MAPVFFFLKSNPPVVSISSPLESEELLYVLSHLARLLSRKNNNFLKFWTCLFWKSVHFLKFGHFFKNGSPGQTTMLTMSAAKFCVEPRSPFSNISHHDPQTTGTPSNIVCKTTGSSAWYNAEPVREEAGPMIRMWALHTGCTDWLSI